MLITFAVLGAKDHDFEHGDFLEHHGTYDRVLMNPPFEHGADIEHVRHAHSLLAEEGTVVAVMSEGPFFRSDRKAQDFRDWLNQVGANSEELPDDAFKGSDAFRETGVRTRLVFVPK